MEREILKAEIRIVNEAANVLGQQFEEFKKTLPDNYVYFPAIWETPGLHKLPSDAPTIPINEVSDQLKIAQHSTLFELKMLLENDIYPFLEPHGEKIKLFRQNSKTVPTVKAFPKWENCRQLSNDANKFGEYVLNTLCRVDESRSTEYPELIVQNIARFHTKEKYFRLSMAEICNDADCKMISRDECFKISAILLPMFRTFIDNFKKHWPQLTEFYSLTHYLTIGYHMQRSVDGLRQIIAHHESIIMNFDAFLEYMRKGMVGTCPPVGSACKCSNSIFCINSCVANEQKWFDERTRADIIIDKLNYELSYVLLPSVSIRRERYDRRDLLIPYIILVSEYIVVYKSFDSSSRIDRFSQICRKLIEWQELPQTGSRTKAALRTPRLVTE